MQCILKPFPLFLGEHTKILTVVDSGGWNYGGGAFSSSFFLSYFYFVVFSQWA